MDKVETKYIAKFHTPNGSLGVLPIWFIDLNRIKPDRVLGCVNHDNHCALYYNEGNYSKADLVKSGYSIVEVITEVTVYEEQKNIFRRYN